MLENFDLSKKLGKADYKDQIAKLEIRLGELQRQARDLGIPVIILFEGWEAAGKGTLINRLALALDARGFNVRSIKPPNEEERLRPFLWRFWIKLPPRGRMAIFDRSWCGRVLEDRIEKRAKKEEWLQAYGEILAFERQLIDGGYLIAKFFLHIDKKEQKRRFKKLEDNPATRWKISEKDRIHHKKYQDYLMAYEEMLVKTHSERAPWAVIEAHDRRHATVQVFKALVDMLSHRIDNEKSVNRKVRARQASPLHLPRLTDSILDRAELTAALTREEYDRRKALYQDRLRELEHEIYTLRIPVVIVYQGWDAAGKGGNIRRLVQKMDPRGYDVIPIGAPNEIENQHHYLWRFWKEFPKAGHIAIFDRSWYGRVLVERIEGFCTEDEWMRAYGEINEMEEQWANFGTVIIKFWLHISSEEQMRRFNARESTAHKQWKITEEDWRNREKWDLYKTAVDEMLFRTSTSYAPWTVIEANAKWFARIKVMKTVIDRLEARLSK